MKTKALIFTALIATAAFASQDTIKLERTYKEGEKDTYRMEVATSMAMGDFTMRMTMSQATLKVYENGDADIETEISGMKLVMNGQEMDMPGGQAGPTKTKQRVNKAGQPVGAAPAGGGMAGGPMGGFNELLKMAMTSFGDRPLVVGQAIPIKSEDGPRKVNGTMKVESVTDGVAKITSDLSIAAPEMQKPMKVNTTTWMNVTTSKMEKTEGTVLGVEAQGMQIDSVKFKMERVK